MYNHLGVRVRNITYAWRRLDAWLNKPLPEPTGLIRAMLAPGGYPWFVPLLAATIVAALALGPTLELSSWAKLAMLLVGLVALVTHHILVWRFPWVAHWLAAGQIILFAALSIAVWLAAGPLGREYDGGLYRHVGLLTAFLLMAGLTLNWLIARYTYRFTDNTLANALPQVELFRPNNRYDFQAKGLLSALAIVPVRYPVELLLPGSLAVLFHPGGSLLWWFLGFTLMFYIILATAVLFERLMEMLETVGRLFFVGPQLLISIFIILVSLLRLAGVHYVTYLFDTGKPWPNLTITVYVFLAYVIAWYYAYWSDQFAARRLIRLLGAVEPENATPTIIRYPYTGRPLTSVLAQCRTLALHGAGRIMVSGNYRDGSGRTGKAFNFLTPQSLLAAFRTQLEALPPPERPNADPLGLVRDLQRGSRVYPVMVGTFAFTLIGGAIWMALTLSVQPPELRIMAGIPANFDLAARLQGSGPNGSCPAPVDKARPRIAIAASGGGTRAAIYTASVLRGLAEADRICDVIVASGVSGGSAALGYFAVHEVDLRRPLPLQPEHWTSFVDTMALPFIQDVLGGASELRVTFGVKAGPIAVCNEANAEMPDGYDRWARARLGQLLAEDFVCTMGARDIGKVGFGLLLNTALAGRFPREGDCLDMTELGNLPLRAWACPSLGSDDVAGGRLVLTNLRKDVLETARTTEQPQMAIVALDDSGIQVPRAAALSANFPPVFPDAAIDIIESNGRTAVGKRYWVTDGGAVENRGTVTLLLSILRTVREMPKDGQLPELHVVVADASAGGEAYAESLGIGSALTAGAQLGLGLESELIQDLRAEYEARHSRLEFHELPMPRVLRNAGIGTHWMLPASLAFQRPDGIPADSETKVASLGADDVKRVILSLNGSAVDNYDDADEAKLIQHWVCNDKTENHPDAWRRLLKALGAPDQPSHDCVDAGGIPKDERM